MDTIIVPFTDKETEAMRYLPQVSMLGIEALGFSHRKPDSRSHAPSWWLAMLHQAENISILFILIKSKFQDTKRYRFIRLHRLLPVLSSIKSSYLYYIQPSIWKWEFSINYTVSYFPTAGMIHWFLGWVTDGFLGFWKIQGNSSSKGQGKL